MPLPFTLLSCGFKMCLLTETEVKRNDNKTQLWYTDCNTSTLSVAPLMPLPPTLMFLNLPDALYI